MRKTFNSKPVLRSKLVVIIAILTILVSSMSALAASRTVPYNLGETLSPSCSPGETNCTVAREVNEGATANNTLRWSGTGWVESSALTITTGGDINISGTFEIGTSVAENAGLDSGNGTVTKTGSDTVITYSTTGNSTFTPPNGVTSVRVLVVAGGGGGGGGIGGGGGAGGLVHNTSFSVTPGTNYTVTVGDGGDGGAKWYAGKQGGNSVFDSITATGGGGGGANTEGSGSGGSGGGGSNAHTNTDICQGKDGTSGQGNKGGNTACTNTNNRTCAGGGGAGSAASDVNDETTGGAGGAGLANDITGSSVTYAGGGGGGRWSDNGSPGAGGSGGGGAGGANGTDGLGGGGGGSSNNDGAGGNGGSGVVIVRFTTQAAQTAVPAITTDAFGYVGIGDITPDGKLEVRNSGIEDILNLYDDTTNVLSVLDGGDLNVDSNTFYVDASSDNIGIGTTSPGGGTTTGSNVLSIANGTAPAGGVANQAGLYAADVTSSSELFAFDEAGNATQISPHDPITGEWVFYSKNTYTGKVVKVNMEKLVEAVEQLTGDEFMIEIYEEPGGFH